ncbi:hypothetical protein Patl1_05165 [Pistacia atlantica]|uniref:Uncharacterized protein n=1 Tax=Pistacia atlantica TaxID=434234 RepID=A0ACC1BWW7_9ROSI|nr:hypothetical protein Patl1_05165 [Pistacia atlantica]
MHDKAELCFLLCSLFPEDYIISLEQLITYGVGLDFYQDAERIEDARNELLSTLNFLKASWCLLDSGGEEFVKMHDKTELCSSGEGFVKMHDKIELCFLLCSLFPEDYIISLEQLITYGVGLDFYQDAERIEDARNELLSTLNFLKASCCLLDSGGEEFVKMHDKTELCFLLCSLLPEDYIISLELHASC